MLNRYATIDVGSNSALMYIADRLPDGRFERVADVLRITKLGEGVRNTGLITPKAISKTVSVLKEYSEIMKNSGVVEYAAVGTMVLREARNTGVFLREVKETTGIDVEIIDGKKEAELSYLAALCGFGVENEDVLVFDIGGGSTEVVFGRARKVHDLVSLDIGALVFSERYLLSDPVKEEELIGLLSYLDSRFSSIDLPGDVELVVGIGGTVTTMASVKLGLADYDSERVQGLRMTVDDVKHQMELYLSKSIEERKRIKGLEPERADIILGGVAILYSLLKNFHISSFFVSSKGVRHGLMIERFGRR